MSHKWRKLRPGWIGVDWDGTVVADTFDGVRPIPRMVNQIRVWLEEGREVKIVTARASDPDPDRKKVLLDEVREECVRLFGKELEITCCKDYNMIALFDDRAYHVIANTGQIVGYGSTS